MRNNTNTTAQWRALTYVIKDTGLLDIDTFLYVLHSSIHILPATHEKMGEGVHGNRRRMATSSLRNPPCKVHWQLSAGLNGESSPDQM